MSHASLIVSMTLAAVCGLAGAAGADEPVAPAPAPTTTPPPVQMSVLRVGAPAPKLSVEKFIKGGPVEIAPGRVYVLDFWATYCPPCREVIPETTRLQEQYAGKVTFIGISAEGVDVVAPFVEKMGAKMNYAVAVDRHEETTNAWRLAAGQNTIPTSFVVDPQGKIAWIGHTSDLERVLARMMENGYDVKKFAEDESRIRSLRREAQRAMRQRDYPRVISKLDEILTIDPQMEGEVGMLKFQACLDKRDLPALYQQIRAVAAGPYGKNPKVLNELAWAIMDNEQITQRDFELAGELSTRCNEMTGYREGTFLDTLARTYWERGNKPKAVEFQAKALEVFDGDDETRQVLTRTLEKYSKP